MKLNLKQGMAFLAVGALMTGCIDDKYDLSDIDTTVKVKVDNLVIPINIDKISLDNVIDLKDDSKIKEIDGEYAFVEDGEFESDDIKIDAINIGAPTIKPTVTPLQMPANLPDVSLAGQTFTFDLAGEKTEFHASDSNVSSSIIEIDHAGCTMTLYINLSLAGFENKIANIAIKDLVMKLPKGLEISNAGNKYDVATGLYKVGDVTSAGNKLSLKFDVSGIDFNKSNVNYDYSRHYVEFSDELAIASGDLVLNGSDIKVPVNQLPTSFSVVTEYVMTDVHISSFTGIMKYDLEGFNITDVNLNDLPDLLTQTGTDIKIANPQIYVSLNNPLNIYSLKAQTGLVIKSYRDNKLSGTYALDAPGYFEIAGKPGTLTYNYYLSPSTVTKLYPGYTGATHVGYNALSNVLSGDGVPTRLSIDFTNPGMPQQKVNNLKLGSSLGSVNGKYTFFAPLALKGGSTIVYTDVLDGWDSEDLEHVVIESLEVNLTVSTTVPIKLELTGYPIDKEGHQINNVFIDGATVDANANNQTVKLHITGQVRGLDGIRFTARAVAQSDEKALSPDMTILLSKIRPVVNGYYEKEL